MRKAPTAAEAALWRELRHRSLDGLKFRRQEIILGWIVDFYCPAAGLVIEVDGSSHRGREAYDARRDAALMKIGLRVLHLRNERVLHDRAAVLGDILSASTFGATCG